MIAERYNCNRVFLVIRFLVLLLLVITISPAAMAQDHGTELQYARQRPPINLSAEATSRIEATIAARRQEKQTLGPDFTKSRTDRNTLSSVSGNRSAEVAYDDAYFDTKDGADYSFPEDAHDFCRASFNNASATQDYYLDMLLQTSESLGVQLAWTAPAVGFTDFDLYLFDENGYPVGDPAGVLEGANGIEYQNDNSNLTETASATNNSGVEQPVLLVVDRFRGDAGSDMSITISGSDAPGAFSVLQYVAEDNLVYVNAVTDQIVGPLANGLSIDLDQVDPARPNFNAVLNTDGCAESYVFSLLDESGNKTVQDYIDNTPPFTLFGDDGNGDFVAGDIPNGNYTLTARSYTLDDGMGEKGDSLSVQFSIVSGGPAVTGFTLINAATDQPIAGFDPIPDGGVIDFTELYRSGLSLALLENQLNIRANVADVQGQIEVVNTSLSITLGTGEVQMVSNSDNAADYSVYGDDNAGDFADAALPFGQYALSGTPVVGGIELAAKTVNFAVSGPRFGSFTLIDADLDEPIPEYDPILDGDTINFAALPAQNFSIRVNTVDYDPPIIDVIDFERYRDGNLIATRRELHRPYSLFGDCNQLIGCTSDHDPPYADDQSKPDYFPWMNPMAGNHVVIARAYGTLPSDPSTPIFDMATVSFTLIVSANKTNGLPEEAMLMPNFPNPFNPTTTIRFSLSEAAPVRLAIYDMLGREVSVLVDSALQEGVHELTFDAGELSSGMYLYRLETPDDVQVRPMTLLK